MSSVYLWPLAANRNGVCKRRRGGEIASVDDDFGKKKRKGIRKGRKGRKRDFGTWNAGEFKLPCSAERLARVCGLSKALVMLARWGPSRQKTSLVRLPHHGGDAGMPGYEYFVRCSLPGIHPRNGFFQVSICCSGSRGYMCRCRRWLWLWVMLVLFCRSWAVDVEPPMHTATGAMTSFSMDQYARQILIVPNPGCSDAVCPDLFNCISPHQNHAPGRGRVFSLGICQCHMAQSWYFHS